MTDTADQQPLPQLQVNAQYVKDLSYEVPGAPGIFAELAGASPEISVRVDLAAEPLQKNVYEVVLQLAIDAKIKDHTAFIVELSYGGVFTLNIPEEHVQPVLLIECPRLLFPFARNIVADVTREGGFPPMMLQPIDFVSLYRSRMEQAAQQQPQGTA
ncbi:protein-export chaperone SecB [Telmatospirillum sp.]|uniref:protein-export chaperone SecB n=1 Tax=Telmatospirillum sp. TaxID=2079197 RepID=UPI00284EEF5D|nr:protein-export chaperone SecB [Telmatospirillum sp.]MDR3439612.1 protein-export chaperone SecB [Telmatospirillum sp.]